MCFIERETRNVILKFREISPWRETAPRAHRIKSDEKPFFCQIYAIFLEKWDMLWLTDIFLYFWGDWRFFLTWGFTDSPINLPLPNKSVKVVLSISRTQMCN